MVDSEETGESAEAQSVATEPSVTTLDAVLEALIFVSDAPIRVAELARASGGASQEVLSALGRLRAHYESRGIVLDEVAGGFCFRTNAKCASQIREMKQPKPLRLTRAQIETLAILAYRQPITRPEVDEVRGVDSGATLKVLLERDLVRILGKKDEPGRPILYGTTPHFLEFFGLRSLRDLPTLREFTELCDDSRRTLERELGEAPEEETTSVDLERDGAPLDLEPQDR